MIHVCYDRASVRRARHSLQHRLPYPGRLHKEPVFRQVRRGSGSTAGREVCLSRSSKNAMVPCALQ